MWIPFCTFTQLFCGDTDESLEWVKKQDFGESNYRQVFQGIVIQRKALICGGN